jgi:hypothetical protein
MTRLLRFLSIGIGESVAEMMARGVRMSLNDCQPHHALGYTSQPGTGKFFERRNSGLNSFD